MDLAALAEFKIGSFTLGDIFTAVLAALICLLLIRIVMRLVGRLFEKSKLDSRIKSCILFGIKILLYIVAALTVIGILGVPTTSLVALLSVSGLAFSLAAENVLSNVAGGFVILSAKPFNIGEFVEISGVSGTVAEVSLIYTKLDTADGRRVLIPNKTIAGGQITNFTSFGRRRISHKIKASYDAPPQRVLAACQAAVAATANVLKDPAAAVYVAEYGASAITYDLFCWSDTEHYWEVYYELLERVKESFDASGVTMSYEHLNVHILGEKPTS